MQSRKLPPDHEVAHLYEGGMALAAIAGEYGTTVAAVSLALGRVGRSPGRQLSGYMPVGLHADHYHTVPAKCLRYLARREKGLRPLSSADNVRLDNWLRMLRDEGLAVAYDAKHPPNPASPTYGGWYYVKRPADLPDGQITVYGPA